MGLAAILFEGAGREYGVVLELGLVCQDHGQPERLGDAE
jgi:hypothetical protein